MEFMVRDHKDVVLIATAMTTVNISQCIYEASYYSEQTAAFLSTDKLICFLMEMQLQVCKAETEV
jgi:hypothetical protein